jgi:single-strand selective monofunctional uracil DNA glycosylase
MSLVRISRRLARDVEGLRFSSPVRTVYNPLVYARRPHEAYLRRFGQGRKEILLLGMNPGPFGMAQTGVPFGDVVSVREWLGIEEDVEIPPEEHPKRRIEGFACPRREVSGTRLWSWARERFGKPEAFFARFFVWNYCPLAFLEEGGRNCTPNRLRKAEGAPLYEASDRALRGVVGALGVGRVVGIGAFAEGRAAKALRGTDVAIGRILHPSPASPRANKGWARQAERELEDLGIRL